jgi:ABC-2 type transport system permease protein
MIMLARHARIVLRFWKNSLIREMTFRGHFFINVIGELSWIFLLLVFIKVIFNQTADVQGWTQPQYLFLMGTHMIITSLYETFFFGNCWRISHLVRTGNLDFVLVRPVNVQFLLSLERIEFSPMANIPVGAAICIWAAAQQGTSVTAGRLALFVLLVFGGVMILYALLFMFAVTSVWLIRLTGLEHLWFYTVSLARYPAEIYKQFAGGLLWFTGVFIIPILMVSNLPANVMMRTFDPRMVIYILMLGGVLLVASHFTCNMALRWYRSASS